LEYLLRDIHFCVRTDHKNLTYLKESVNQKVYRWKLKIQEFDFDIEYIPGEKNIVADGLSRFISNSNNIGNVEHQLLLLDDFKLSKEQYQLISKVHNSVVGHHGVERTVSKLHSTNQRWPYMREHVRKFIKQCPACQKMSYLKVPIHTHPYTTAAYGPMQRINIDTIGPLPADDNGNTYIIVIVDCFTRWIELYCAKDATSKSAAYAYLDHMGRYGCANQILSDNGSQYVNQMIDELVKLIDTEHIRTLAYSHEENAIVERSNKEVVRHLRAMVFDKNISHIWSTCKPFIQRIINSSVDSSIGVSPSQLLFGNAIDLDRGILTPFENVDPDGRPLSAWSSALLDAQRVVMEFASTNQQEKDKMHMENNNNELLTEFPIGSFVLVLNHGARNKLQTFLKGPLKVKESKGAHYYLENLVTGKIETYHCTQLRQFIYDPDNVDPVNVANSDEFCTVVDKIISHTPVRDNYRGQRVSEMKFTVRWKNLPAEYDRELPWKELRNNPALHSYLNSNRMASLVPREHRNKN